jgi:hypothetical protein
MTHRFWSIASNVLLATVPLLSACGAEDSGKVTAVIVDGAKRLKSSGQTELTVKYQPPDTMPYVLVIYPAVRTPDDEAALERIAPKAKAISQAGAALSPKSEGFTNTIALWRKGALATFDTSCRGTAEAAMVLAVAKDRGGPTEITLSRAGPTVYIVALR